MEDIQQGRSAVMKLYRVFEDHMLPRVKLVHYAQWVSNADRCKAWTTEEKLQHASMYVRNEGGNKFQKATLRNELSKRHLLGELKATKKSQYVTALKKLEDFMDDTTLSPIAEAQEVLAAIRKTSDEK